MLLLSFQQGNKIERKALWDGEWDGYPLVCARLPEVVYLHLLGCFLTSPLNLNTPDLPVLDPSAPSAAKLSISSLHLSYFLFYSLPH